MHPNAIDLTGQKFGRLTVIERAGPDSTRHIRWLCQCNCSCGAKTIVRSSHLRKDRIKSCGCLQREQWGMTHFIHGMRYTPEYRTWAAMKNRCLNKQSPAYENYGGRGITVCERWKRSFKNFFKDMGDRPPGTSINRVDNDGPYTKSNCTWSTPKEQANNRRPAKKRKAAVA